MTCSLCKEVKPPSGFYVRTDRGRQRLRKECKECVKARTANRYRRRIAEDPEAVRAEGRDWRNRNRDKLAAQNRRARLRKYGLNEESYAAMLDEQEHKCAICHNEFGEERRPNVDHCHSTGMVRGILCWPCNSSLGKFGENATLLRAAADYLDHAEGRLGEC